MGTYHMRDLIEATGVTDRMVRQYIQRGLLPYATGRGTGPVYTEEHLIRLRAIRKLLSQRYSLDAIKRSLAKLSLGEVAQLGAPPEAPSEPSDQALPDDPAPPPASEPAPMLERNVQCWERVVLLPGIELHVRSDAGALARRVAQEICEQYSVRD